MCRTYSSTTANSSLLIALALSALLHALIGYFLLRHSHQVGYTLNPGMKQPSLQVRFSHLSFQTSPTPSVPEPTSIQTSIPEIPLQNPGTIPDDSTTPVNATAEGAGSLGLFMYLPAEILDQKPKVLTDVPANLPELDRFQDEGRLVLRLRIGALGTVDGVEVLSSTLPDDISHSLTQAFSKMRFMPGIKDKQPVASFIDIEVSITPGAR